MLTEEEKQKIGELVEFSKVLATNMTTKEIKLFHGLALERFRISMYDKRCKGKLDPLTCSTKGD